MRIQLNKAGKRFNRDWIFRNLDQTFHPAGKYAIIGPNGSGKSTLLQVLSGGMNLTEGTIEWGRLSETIPTEEIFRSVSLVAPYLDLIEEMSAREFLEFHRIFKSLVLPTHEILKLIGLEQAADKQIRNFSSGMKQRIKLAQAIFSDTQLLLLDEPCTNLDSAGYDLYHALIADYCGDRLVIVSSNDTNEYSFCDQFLNLVDYKINIASVL